MIYFDIQLNEPTNQISIKVPKVVKQTNKICYHITLGTSVINIPMSNPSLKLHALINMRNKKKSLTLQEN